MKFLKYFTYSYIFSIKLFTHPRDWHLGIIYEKFGHYGIYLFCISITLYVWQPVKPILAPSNDDYVKSFCCNANVVMSNFKIEEETGFGIPHNTEFSCSKCGKKLNEVGGKLIE